VRVSSVPSSSERAVARAAGPPGFQGRRDPRAGGRPAASPGSLGLRTDLGAGAACSRTARSVGVELVASPCQRLRGCRHLQPSTGPSSDERRPPVEMPARTRDPRWRVEFRISNAARRRRSARRRSPAIDRRERARWLEPTASPLVRGSHVGKEREELPRRWESIYFIETLSSSNYVFYSLSRRCAFQTQ